MMVVYVNCLRATGSIAPNGIFTAPLTKDLADQLPEDYAKTVAYPHYRAMLTKESAGQQ